MMPQAAQDRCGLIKPESLAKSLAGAVICRRGMCRSAWPESSSLVWEDDEVMRQPHNRIAVVLEVSQDRRGVDRKAGEATRRHR